MVWLKLALALAQLLQLILSQVQQAKWEASGEAKALLKILNQIQVDMAKAIAVREEVAKMEETEVDDILRS